MEVQKLLQKSQLITRKAMQSSDALDQTTDFLAIMTPITWYDLWKLDCPFVLNMDLSEEDMLKRLLERSKSSGRSDDNEETISKRSKTFIKTRCSILRYV
jgi:adenylate kinase family enzyme